MSNLPTKFGWILSNGLGDSVTYGWTAFWPLPRAPGAGQKKCAVAHPIHVSNSHPKFGWILSNGLGGDSMTVGLTDRWTDGGHCNIPIVGIEVFYGVLYFR